MNRPVGSIDMPLISRDVPAFSSSGSGASNANDSSPTTSWSPGSLPGWLAYDVSGAAEAQRGQILVSFNALHTLDYINSPPQPSMQLPTDYTVEVNAAAGGGDPPTDGWKTVATISGNTRSSVQSLVDLAKGNWVRINITQCSDPAGVPAIDLDVYSAPNGGTNSWLFMGDSITFMSTHYYVSDLPALVDGQHAGRWPAVIDAAIGGTNTTTAVNVIDDTMSGFPGRFVVLAYGTNDHPQEYQMEALVQKVIAAGKLPVVPHMPWADSKTTEGPEINSQIDALYDKYSEIVRGPDLWSAFENRTDLIAAGDIHPNDAGQEELRKQWANTIAALQ